MIMKNKGKSRKKEKKDEKDSEEFHLRCKYNEDNQWHREIMNKQDTPEIYKKKTKSQVSKRKWERCVKRKKESGY